MSFILKTGSYPHKRKHASFIGSAYTADRNVSTTNCNKACRYDTQNEAKKALNQLIADVNLLIKEVKVDIINQHPPHWDTKYYTNRLKRLEKNKAIFDSCTVVPFEGDITYNDRYRGKINWRKIEPFTSHCSCCGFIIPVAQCLITTSSQLLCPVCISRAAELSKQLVENFEKSNPTLYNKMVGEMLLKEL